MTHTHAWGYGIATIAGDGTTLDTWFPAPQLGQPPATDPDLVPAHIEELEGEDARRDVRLSAVMVAADLGAPPASTSDAYLRLHLLSHLLVEPNSINLDGIFAQLPNV
ncbi:MAG: 2,3,4,5-tetrahydropyridine-2,6-dicarboxylate N-succinyltransferase, partial [Cryobacterium sp.]|nr:2,3,4,5-tetrahydropyridine-2,6-dicarboxylate N-succinyltransferase [Cryobacterium sp.]